MSKMLIISALMCASLQAQVAITSNEPDAESSPFAAELPNPGIDWNRALLARHSVGSHAMPSIGEEPEANWKRENSSWVRNIFLSI